MMNDFFTILNLDRSDMNLTSRVELNPNHGVYEGHFPNQPVVPGVCMIYMIKTILAIALEKDIQFEKIGSSKFIKMLNPAINNSLDFEFKLDNPIDKSMKVQVSGMSDGEVFIKLKGLILIG